MKDDYNKTKNNQFTNNNFFEDKNNRNSLNSISIKANASNLTGRRYFENTNNEFNSNSNFNNNLNSNQYINNLNNTNNNNNNYQLINNEMEELKQYIYNYLLNSNKFIKFFFSKYKENESIEKELKENEI